MAQGSLTQEGLSAGYLQPSKLTIACASAIGQRPAGWAVAPRSAGREGSAD